MESKDRPTRIADTVLHSADNKVNQNGEHFMKLWPIIIVWNVDIICTSA